MTSGDWIGLSALVVSLLVGALGYLRHPTFTLSSTVDTLQAALRALKERCIALEHERDECKQQLAAIRDEIAWMRANMVLRSTRGRS